MSTYRFFAILTGLTLLSGCGMSPESAVGFRLPDGDTDRGRQAFEALRCNGCHTVEGVDVAYVGQGDVEYALGGTTTRVRTYGELVTSIINPSHRIAPGYRTPEVEATGESPMASARLNEVMTVQQLIDLVAFLQAQYAVVPPEIYPYSRIYP
jgi:sulfur-oxidizing protein SoxX